jgi:hypothetical protein
MAKKSFKRLCEQRSPLAEQSPQQPKKVQAQQQLPTPSEFKWQKSFKRLCEQRSPLAEQSPHHPKVGGFEFSHSCLHLVSLNGKKGFKL